MKLASELVKIKLLMLLACSLFLLMKMGLPEGAAATAVLCWDSWKHKSLAPAFYGQHSEREKITSLGNRGKKTKGLDLAKKRSLTPQSLEISSTNFIKILQKIPVPGRKIAFPNYGWDPGGKPN